MDEDRKVKKGFIAGIIDKISTPFNRKLLLEIKGEIIDIRENMEREIQEFKDRQSNLENDVKSIQNRLSDIEEIIGMKINSMESNLSSQIDSRVWKAEENLSSQIDSRVWKAEENLSSQIDSRVWKAEENLSSQIDSRVWKAEENLSSQIDSRVWKAEENLSSQIDSRVWKAEENLGFRIDSRVWKAEENLGSQIDNRVWKAEKNLGTQIDHRTWKAEESLGSQIDARVWKAELYLKKEILKNLWNLDAKISRYYRNEKSENGDNRLEMIYGDWFYEENQYLSIVSGVEVFKRLLPELKPRSIVDFGCGTGTWLAAAGKISKGVELVGLDGDYVNREMLLINKEDFISADLSRPVDLKRKFDFALSMEVAEHIDKKDADIFVDNICRHSDIILFSAAHPGQGGDGHVNEQPIEYWIKKFEKRGYKYIDIRDRFKINYDIEVYYKENMGLYVKESNHIDKT